MDKSKSREDNAKRGVAYAKADRETEQLWEGKFIRPTEGQLTSPFGKYREYNNEISHPRKLRDCLFQMGNKDESIDST